MVDFLGPDNIDLGDTLDDRIARGEMRAQADVTQNLLVKQ